MNGQLGLQAIIKEKLKDMRRDDARFSLRDMAKLLAMNVGALSEILSGKRNVSRELAEKIILRLQLDPQQRKELLGLFPVKNQSNEAADHYPKSSYVELDEDELKQLNEWEHFAVLSLMNCDDFDDQPALIASRLGVSTDKVVAVLQSLFRTGQIRLSEKGVLERTHAAIRTSDDTASLILRNKHKDSLDKAAASLVQDNPLVRDFTGITFAIDPLRIDAAKVIIRRCQDDLACLLEAGNRTEVYRFATQLFPVTKLRQ